MKRSSLRARHCSIARAGSTLVDAWTFVILREVFLANRRFDGILVQSGMSPRSLTLRLKSLVESDLLERVVYQQRPTRHEYCLTAKGIDFWPVMVALKQWGDRWEGPWGRDGAPLKLLHKAADGTEHRLQACMVCADCGEPVNARAARTQPGRAMAQERAAMAEQLSRRRPSDPKETT